MSNLVIIQSAPISPEKFELFRKETKRDSELVTVMKIVQEGWPEHMKECPKEAKEYFTIRDELTEVDGILFKDAKIVVPKSLRKDILILIH